MTEQEFTYALGVCCFSLIGGFVIDLVGTVFCSFRNRMWLNLAGMLSIGVGLGYAGMGLFGILVGLAAGTVAFLMISLMVWSLVLEQRRKQRRKDDTDRK